MEELTINEIPPSRWKLAVFLTVLGAVAIFWLPFHVPVQPATSEAYLVGYNNRAGLLSFLVFAIVFAVTAKLPLLRFPPGAPARDFLWRARPLIYSIAIVVSATTSIWLIRRGLPSVNESTYCMTRLLAWKAGGRIYRDVEWAYGPLLLYIPLIVQRVFHLGLGDSYGLSWIAEWILGTCLLWYFVDRALPASARQAKTIFWLFFGFIFASLASLYGHNYTLLRFMAAPAVAISLYSANASRKRYLRSFALASLGLVITFSLSQEQGLALFLSTLVYFALVDRRRSAEFWIGLTIFLVSGAGAIAVLWNMGAYDTALHMASGGLNFPILFHISHISVFTLLTVATCALVNAARDRKLVHPFTYLCLLATMLLPAAYSRCDIPHLVENLMPALLVALAVLASTARGWKFGRACFLLGVTLIPVSTLMYLTRGTFAEPLRYGRMYGRGIFGFLLASHKAAPHGSVPLHPSLVGIFTGEGRQQVLAPFSYRPTMSTNDEHVQFPFTGKYEGTENVVNQDQIEKKIAELSTHPTMLVAIPADTTGICEFDGGNARFYLKMFFRGSYIPPQKNQITTFHPLCEAIVRDYHPVNSPSPILGYVLWQRDRK